MSYLHVYSGHAHMSRIIGGRRKNKDVDLYILAENVNKARSVVLRDLGAKAGAVSQSISIELVSANVTREEWKAWLERDKELDPEFSRWLQVHREGY